jgi:outer membrane protein OmpA-like peptidoglycan-associated protein
MLKKLSAIVLAFLIGTIGVLGQTENQVRNVAVGQKLTVKGVVVAKDTDKIVVRDATGIDTNILLTSATSIKTKGGFFRSGDAVASSQIVGGLYMEIEGAGDGAGNLVAKKVRFSKDDFKVAQSIDSRVTPAEERLSQAEENAQRISGQIDELMAVSNAARGGAKAAQDTADAAVAGVNATNQRISALDDYVVQSTSTVNFKVKSAVLLPDAKTQLDQIAQTALTMKGFVLEVTGFASADGNEKMNKALSQKRAQAVIDYLVETHNIPLRRISTSYGFGELQAVADNTTREGREQNRRVEVKILASRGLNQNVEVRTTTPPDPNQPNQPELK